MARGIQLVGATNGIGIFLFERDGNYAIGYRRGYAPVPNGNSNAIELSDYYPEERLMQVSGIGALHGHFQVEDGTVLYSSDFGTMVQRNGRLISAYGVSIDAFVASDGQLLPAKRNGLRASGDFLRLEQGDVLTLGERVVYERDHTTDTPVSCRVISGSNPIQVRVL